MICELKKFAVKNRTVVRGGAELAGLRLVPYSRMVLFGYDLGVHGWLYA